MCKYFVSQTITFYICNRGYSGRDVSSAATLLSCLIISSKEVLDMLHPLLPQILGVSYKRLLTIKSQQAKVRLLEVFLASFYYDASYTLMILSKEDPQVIVNLCNCIFENLKNMDRDFTQRLIVLSFMSILAIPSSNLPNILSANVGSMFQQIIRELVLIEEESKKQHSEDNDSDTNSRYDDDDFGADLDDDYDDTDPALAAGNRAKKLYVPDGGYNEDEDCLNAEDEEYRQMLESMDNEDKAKRQLYLAGEPVDDEDEDDFAYTSPIENFQIIRMFFDELNVWLSRDLGYVTSLKAQLNSEDTQRLEQLYTTAFSN